MASRAAVTTVHRASQSFIDWCAYHQQHFDFVFVMIDDPDELDKAQSLETDRIRIQLGAQIPHASQLTQTLLRQEANATAAVQECCRRGIDWLLHLDGDELFLPQSTFVWERDSSIGQMIFPNHEACAKWVVNNPFREIRHFKKSNKLPFLLYRGGKAAVRCKSGIHADGPHRFAGYDGISTVSRSASILHYACFSFDSWLEKYRQLGLFSDWYKDDFRCPITLDFHLQSRDIVHKAVEDQDFEGCRRYFATTVWDEDELERGVANGSLLLISPESLLSQLTQIRKSV